LRRLEAPLAEALDVGAGFDETNRAIGDVGVMLLHQVEAELPSAFNPAFLATFSGPPHHVEPSLVDDAA
jgi:hypothetical protein